MTVHSLLSNEHREDFSRNGMTIIRQFFDVKNEILPIQKAIYQIIGLVMQRHGLTIERQPFSGDNFDNGYAELIKANRQYGGEVYDLVKQIPAFIRLISSVRSEQLFCELRGTDLAGIGAGSYGIRIDNPFEEQFRSQWHQEFLFQPQSMDGIVVWTPLVPVAQDMGPMIVCLESHKDGLCTYSKGKSYEQKTGAYKIGIQNDNEVAARYQQVAPLTVPGDLIVMDYLTIHQSGINISNRSRWSIQSRFFNFCDPTGMRIGWKSSVTAGTDIETIFPEYFAETNE
jgi:hypothetical protein